MKRTFTLLTILFLLHSQSKSQVVYDYDGNAYDTVIIGTQVWMKQNLKTTHYSNGVSINEVKDSVNWAALTTGARCYYNNDSVSNHALYGGLYNWYAAVSPNKICPLGWHVPSTDEWSVLENYLGGWEVAGGKMKSSGITIWATPNINATNSSRFSGLPAGMRGMNDAYSYQRENVLWWSSSPASASMVWSRYLWNMSGEIYANPTQKKLGLCIRCLRDAATDIKTLPKTNGFNVYPNPATNKITITSAYENEYSVSIYSNVGQLILQKNIQSREYELPVEQLPPGIYLLIIEGTDFSSQQKIVKQ